jgi:uncharacterized protein YbjT (DUF2867 family)
MKLLITGATGFTGNHLIPLAAKSGYTVYSLKANLTDLQAVMQEVATAQPTK